MYNLFTKLLFKLSSVKNQVIFLFTKLLFKLLSVKKQVIFLFIISISSLFIFSTTFLSCIPGNIFGNKTSETDFIVEEPSSDFDDDNDDNSNRRYRRKRRKNRRNTDNRVEICEGIYDDATAKTNCKNESRDTVDKLEQIYIYLDANNVAAITNSNLLTYFEKYLVISADKWIQNIRQDNNISNAQNILKWLAENENAAETLLDLGNNKGEEILKALIGKLASSSSSPAPACAYMDFNNDIHYLVVDIVTSTTAAAYFMRQNSFVTNVAKFTNKKRTIKLDESKELEILLYKKFLCKITDEDEENIFILSNNEGNQYLFDLASKTLTNICGELVDASDLVTVATDVDAVKECVDFITCWSLERAGGSYESSFSTEYYNSIDDCKDKFRKNSEDRGWHAEKPE